MGKGSRGDVTILPTLVVNNHQYRGLYSHLYFTDKFWMLAFLTYLHIGKLAKGAVLKAICAGFEETTEPAVCLSGGKFVLLYFLAREVF